MPLDQRNLGFFSYDSDDGTSYCIKGDALWGADGDSGGSACAGEPAYGAATTRRSPRYAIFRDPTTFRTFKSVVYTPAAYAALTIGTSTQLVTLPGSVTQQSYTLVKKVPERIPSTVIGRQLSDHA
jgi:hypothetical protein